MQTHAATSKAPDESIVHRALRIAVPVSAHPLAGGGRLSLRPRGT